MSTDTEHIFVIKAIHLFEDDECYNCVGSETHVVGSEALPEGEEPFVLDDSGEDVDSSLVFGLSVDDPHVLDSSLGDVDRHTRDRCSQSGHHGAEEVAEDSILDISRVQNSLFCLGVRSQLSSIHNHRSADSRTASLKSGENSEL